jgi:hypothetical protein
MAFRSLLTGELYLLSLTIIVLPVNIFTRYIPIFRGLTVIFVIYTSYILMLAVANKIQGARILLAGGLFLSLDYKRSSLPARPTRLLFFLSL